MNFRFKFYFYMFRIFIKDQLKENKDQLRLDRFHILCLFKFKLVFKQKVHYISAA